MHKLDIKPLESFSVEALGDERRDEEFSCPFCMPFLGGFLFELRGRNARP